MRFTTYGMLLSFVTIVAVFGYTVLNTKQLLEVIKHQPGCFPPYILSEVRLCRKAATTSDLTVGRDGGLKPLGLRRQAELYDKYVR